MFTGTTVYAGTRDNRINKENTKSKPDLMIQDEICFLSCLCYKKEISDDREIAIKLAKRVTYLQGSVNACKTNVVDYLIKLIRMVYLSSNKTCTGCPNKLYRFDFIQDVKFALING